ncbi:hypothetical protein C0995_012406 [Termitomyces sp. Mi166|nr:hypothetical protein C0995_012406 [Termitomyces sp. Mi166\
MPYYGPDEPPETIFLERTFLAADFLGGTGYGEYMDATGVNFELKVLIPKSFSGAELVLYASCSSFLWKTRHTRAVSRYLLAYMTLLISIETLFMIVQAKTVQDIYIDNRNYPGGPWAYFLATQNLAINVMFYATFCGAAGSFGPEKDTKQPMP